MAKANNLLTCLVFWLACYIPSIWGQGADDQPVIETKYGSVRGRVRLTENGIKVYEFLGIPYAAPPVGDLRFKNAQILANFTEVYDATKMPAACPQYSEQPLPWYDLEPNQSEDCLYLNIWTPIVSDFGKWSQNARPVKFYVHGGGWFDAGSNRMPYYDGFGQAIDTLDEEGNSKKDGIVVVSVNYRLGALGFLGADTDDAMGNVGLVDIETAYNWTKSNIAFFGGNIRSRFVTVEGEGSGSILVTLLRKQINDRFKMIVNGATFLTLQSLEGVEGRSDSRSNNRRLTDLLSQKLDCGSLNDSSKNAIECLRDVEAPRLVKAAASLSQGRGPPNVFLPSWTSYPGQILNYLLTIEFEKTFTDKKVRETAGYYINGLDTLTTFTRDDGSALLTTTFPKVFGAFGDKDIPLSAACAKKVTRRFLKKFPQSVADALLGDLDKSATLANRAKVVKAFGDAYFNCPMVFYAEELKRIQRMDINKRVKAAAQVNILEKQVCPPYKPFACWMGYVDFYNVQNDFVHPDGQIIVNGQTYKYTANQTKQARTNLELHMKFMQHSETANPIPFPEFTLEDPAYGVLLTNGSFSNEKKSNLHQRNCDILRPYFNETQKT